MRHIANVFFYIVFAVLTLVGFVSGVAREAYHVAIRR